MVFCTYCGRSFTRDEHLERHILTHTNVKPFKCMTCHMSFTRAYHLRKHYAVHSSKDPVMATNSTERTPIACTNCAKKKIKCDKKFPCSRCAAKHLECVLRISKKSAMNTALTGTSPSDRSITVSTSSMPPAETETLQQIANETAILKDCTTILQDESGLSLMDMSTKAAVEGPWNLYAQDPTSRQTFSPSNSSSSSITRTISSALITPLSEHDEDLNMVRDGLESHCDAISTPDRGRISTESDELLGSQMIIDGRVDFDTSLLPPIGYEGLIHAFDARGPPVAQSKLLTEDNPFSHWGLGGLPTPLESQGLYRYDSTSSPPFHLIQDSQEQQISSTIPEEDAWPSFQCTPTVSSSFIPNTAKLNLEKLEDTLQDFETWTTRRQRDEADHTRVDIFIITKLNESTRDKLTSQFWKFLHRAFEKLEKGRDDTSAEGHDLKCRKSSRFAPLPPAETLHSFLRSYIDCFECHYPTIPRATLDINALVHNKDNFESLLAFLMIAQGAVAVCSTKAHEFACGLVEMCGILLFDSIDPITGNALPTDGLLVLQAALVYITQAAWNGDKWQMEAAIRRRGTCLAMLRNFDNIHGASNPYSAGNQQIDMLWNEWLQSEKRSRIIYSWMLVDQELALFHDTAPFLSITDLGPMPDADCLWHARNATEWSSIFERVHEFSGSFSSSIGSGARPMTLCNLFRYFLDEKIINLGIEMTPLQLRLLLYPLQILVYQYSQLLCCCSGLLSKNSDAVEIGGVSSQHARPDAIQSLLRRWYGLAERFVGENSMCPAMQVNLVIFNIISLNAISNVREIECVARHGVRDRTEQQRTRCVSDVEQARFCCGQVLHIIDAMPSTTHPPWLAAAVYRVALILWICSASPQQQHPGAEASLNAAIHIPGPSCTLGQRWQSNDPTSKRVCYLHTRNGFHMSLNQPAAILRHCALVIGQGPTTSFTKGMKSKLERLARCK